MNKRIFLSPPHLGLEEFSLVTEAFASNWIAPLGPHVDAFEKEVAGYLGLADGVALNSGTSAIHLGLKLLDVNRDDTVFCSSFTFVGSANPILYEGAKPVFIDSEPGNWNMSVSALALALEDSARNNRLPKAIVVASLYGQSADFPSLQEVASRYEVPIIEDAAESLGATFHGKKSGSFGQLSILSFNGNKIITTSGGGMLLGNDAKLLEKARFWSTQARDPAPHYQHSEVGYNYRLSNVLAAIGRGQMRILDQRVIQRRGVYERYAQAFSDIEGFEGMPEASGAVSSRWLSVFTIDPSKLSIMPIQLIEKLALHNIEARLIWKPLHLQPLFKNVPYYRHEGADSFCDKLFEYGLCLPSGSALTMEEQDLVIEVVRENLLASCQRGVRHGRPITSEPLSQNV